MRFALEVASDTDGAFDPTVGRTMESRGFNREHGMSSVSPVAVREKALSPLHVLAQVRWSARFEKTGARGIEFEIAYLMERAGESWHVLGYVMEGDQEEEMRALGLL